MTIMNTYPLTITLSCRAKGLNYEKTLFVRGLSKEDKYRLVDEAEKLIWNTVEIAHE